MLLNACIFLNNSNGDINKFKSISMHLCMSTSFCDALFCVSFGWMDGALSKQTLSYFRMVIPVCSSDY
jgi:hypothetical protein